MWGKPWEKAILKTFCHPTKMRLLRVSYKTLGKSSLVEPLGHWALRVPILGLKTVGEEALPPPPPPWQCRLWRHRRGPGHWVTKIRAGFLPDFETQSMALMIPALLPLPLSLKILAKETMRSGIGQWETAHLPTRENNFIYMSCTRLRFASFVFCGDLQLHR